MILVDNRWPPCSVNEEHGYFPLGRAWAVGSNNPRLSTLHSADLGSRIWRSVGRRRKEKEGGGYLGVLLPHTQRDPTQLKRGLTRTSTDASKRHGLTSACSEWTKVYFNQTFVFWWWLKKKKERGGTQKEEKKNEMKLKLPNWFLCYIFLWKGTIFLH